MRKILHMLKKNIALVVVILIICVSFILLYSHSNFFRSSIQNKEFSIANNIEITSDAFDENHKLSIDGNQSKIIEISIKNNFKTNKRVSIWYRSDAGDSLKVGNYNNTKFKLLDSGCVLESEEVVSAVIGIKNETDKIVTVEFGVQFAEKVENIIAPTNAKFITGDINVDNYMEYSVGEKVALLDNSTWHVLKESSSVDDYILLLKDSIISIYDSKQAIDAKNNMVLYSPSDDNILYYLDNNYRKELEDQGIKLGEEAEIRLISLNELQSVGEYEYKDYVYYQKVVPAWINIQEPWWTMTPFSQDSHYYVKDRNIYYTKESKQERYAIRPVVKLLKSNIK